MYSLNCYHGTFDHAAKSIIENGFESSSGARDWLGEGVYFFESNDPDGGFGKKNAIKWVYKRWYDSNGIFKKFSIIKSLVEVGSDYLLDLTIPRQFEYFHIFRQEYLTEQFKRGLKFKPPKDGVELDAIIVRKICSKMRVDVVRKYDYIRFPRDARLKINSRMPNSILVCVKNKSECIKSTVIEEEGDIDVRSKEYL